LPLHSDDRARGSPDALFRVSTLDLANLPRTAEGKVDFAHDFFGRKAFLTVSGHLNIEHGPESSVSGPLFSRAHQSLSV